MKVSRGRHVARLGSPTAASSETWPMALQRNGSELGTWAWAWACAWKRSDEIMDTLDTKAKAERASKPACCALDLEAAELAT